MGKNIFLLLSLLSLSSTLFAAGLASNPTPFINVQPAHYWSSETNTSDPTQALQADASSGLGNVANKQNNHAYVFLELGGAAILPADCDGKDGVNIQDIVCTIYIVLDPSQPGNGNCDGNGGVDRLDVFCAITAVIQR